MKYYAAYGVVIPYRRFRTTYRSHLQGHRLFRNAGNYLPPYAAPEERISRLLRGGSLKRRTAKCVFSAETVEVKNK